MANTAIFGRRGMFVNKRPLMIGMATEAEFVLAVFHSKICLAAMNIVTIPAFQFALANGMMGWHGQGSSYIGMTIKAQPGRALLDRFFMGAVYGVTRRATNKPIINRPKE